MALARTTHPRARANGILGESCDAQRIHALAEPYREVIALRLVHGLDPASIAHTLGRPPGTVRMQLKRGLERLRGLLPAGAALSAAALLSSGRGLASVRATVLH